MGGSGYHGMLGFDHESVKHSVGEYVDGMAHINGIESFWSMLKRGYHGTYHRMSAKHLQRYVDESSGRHNIRGQQRKYMVSYKLLRLIFSMSRWLRQDFLESSVTSSLREFFSGGLRSSMSRLNTSFLDLLSSMSH